MNSAAVIRSDSAIGADGAVLCGEGARASARRRHRLARQEEVQLVRRAAGPRMIGGRGAALAALAVVIAAGLSVVPAFAGEGGRVVVIVPTPGGTDVPVGPNEKVSTVTVVTLPGGVQVAVVRIDPMPAKPDFNIITPDGSSHPFTNGPTGVAGESVRWVSQPLHHPDGSTSYEIYGEYTGPGYRARGTTQKYPPGSRCVPDPPQPPGLMFSCPDAYPADPGFEAQVLAWVGMPDNPEPEVYWVPSCEFWFTHDTSPEPMLVWMGSEPRVVPVANYIAEPAGVSEFVSAVRRPGWSEDFDSYEAGTNLHGLGGWKGWDGDAVFGAIVSDVEAHSVPNSVDVAGDADLVREFTRYDAGAWSFATWQYIPSDFVSGGDGQFAGSYFVMMNTYEDGGPHEESDWSVQMQFDSNDGMLKVYYGNGLNTVDVPYATDRWVKIEAIVDLGDDWTRVYYDDALVTEYSWTGGVLGGGGGAAEIAAVDLYANGSTSIFYDDFVLEPLRE